jgi:hypothetical protein
LRIDRDLAELRFVVVHAVETEIVVGGTRAVDDED